MVVVCTQEHDGMKVVGHNDMIVEVQSGISIWQYAPIPICDLSCFIEHHKSVNDIAKSAFHTVDTDRDPIHS
jgi:hypothetical protein